MLGSIWRPRKFRFSCDGMKGRSDSTNEGAGTDASPRVLHSRRTSNIKKLPVPFKLLLASTEPGKLLHGDSCGKMLHAPHVFLVDHVRDPGSKVCQFL